MHSPFDIITPAAKRAIHNIDFSSLRRRGAPHLARLMGWRIASPALLGTVFGSGFFAGALAGAVLSPASGPELRAQIREELLALWNKLPDGRLTPDEPTEESADPLASEPDVVADDATEGDVPRGPDDLRAMKVGELYDIAKQRDIDGRSTMNKSTLVDAIAEDL